MYYLICLTVCFIGIQIRLKDLLLLTNRFNYKISFAQVISYISLVLLISIIVYDIDIIHSVSRWVYAIILSILTGFISEWGLSKLNFRRKTFTYIFRIAILFFISTISYQLSGNILTSILIYGLYLRNSPFGIIHGKDIFLSSKLISRETKESIKFLFNSNSSSVHTTTKIFDVTQYGIQQDGPADNVKKLQELIDKVGSEGGGIIFFPKGRYLFNKNKKDLRFIQINWSNITIEGETDEEGHPLTELIYCNPVPNQKSNPWLAPFFFTTGEELQVSNQFWGLQFKERKQRFTQSNSLSDPGSDGSIQTPEYCTSIIADAENGSKILQVKDSSKLKKYILIGMYNTSKDGNLLKDILGVDCFRSEWTTAMRAGEEKAPSFQWLTEVKRVIDAHTIELSEPLFRPINKHYEPAIFNVPMLENIHFRNLQISSRWNGLFHHHGFPLYYSVKQSREMDYEWNAINMKRTAHSSINNVIIKDFTNPLYVQDTLTTTVNNMIVKGYDGHQGIKIYEHTCNCVFFNIIFLNHYADMMGGEGNAYCNKFHNIRYLNPEFHPVDFDFHGFSEGPMSPPAYNSFENIDGFRYIKAAGAIFNQPSLAQYNSWKSIITKGERKGQSIFYALSYRPRHIIVRQMAALATALVSVIKTKRVGIETIKTYQQKLQELNRCSLPTSEHYQFFKNCILKDIHTTSQIKNDKAFE